MFIMKPLLVFLLLSPAILTLPCSAQRTAGMGVRGFGNVLHPGTPSPSPGWAYNGNRIARRNNGYSSGYISGGYPLYVGGAYVPAYGSSGYAPDYSSQTQLNPQQQQSNPAPPVVINQYFGPPVPPEPVTGNMYQPSSERQQNEEDAGPATNRYYLLAFKDHSIYSALAYWVEDKTL